jgi:sortase A
MKVVIRKTSLKQARQWVERALFAIAIGTLGYCGYVAIDAWMFQRWGRQDFERQLQTRTLTAGTPEIGTDGLIGRIEIQRLGVSTIVVEGTSDPTLQRAAGHIHGTALPGHAGNVGIAGHRDSFFRPLRNIQRNDIITVATLRGEYRYRVVSTKIVNPEDVAVLHQDSHEVLTLVTCYPFYFVGSAPSRFIVRAERVI